ncbi:MAG: (2Fe-2S)-binding protein [Ignavibacteriales bacterium]|nr:MAG: (2Fe-2S)-binding protein [Ignavibacteriales bacterium]
MIKFILNDLNISTDLPPTTVLLDFIRKETMFTGTKEGCREGDCGACTILLGELIKGTVKYKSVNSCLMPLGDANGKHVVTVEGFNQKDLSPVQAAMVDEGGIQCGFCTPGFVVSMTGYFLNNSNLNSYDAIESLGGNICRCTGYAGIKRAANDSISIFENGKSDDRNHLENLISLKFIPNYFQDIKKRLEKISVDDRSIDKKSSVVISGGTDLYVQRWESIVRGKGNLISQDKKLTGISQTGKQINIGSATTIEELKSSKLLQKYFPQWNSYLSLFGSLPIRNRATIGGNIVNASPIGDMVNIFLALNSTVHLKDGKKKRSILLKNFYKGYKSLDKKKNEIVEKISFQIPSKNSFFNFEKISKRTYLDIASVNSSIYIELKSEKIKAIHIATGGVAPIPLYLNNTCNYLRNKSIDAETIKNAAAISADEISPISDARGSAEYKRLLLHQLFCAHFIKLFPQLVDPEKLL